MPGVDGRTGSPPVGPDMIQVTLILTLVTDSDIVTGRAPSRRKDESPPASPPPASGPGAPPGGGRGGERSGYGETDSESEFGSAKKKKSPKRLRLKGVNEFRLLR